MDKLATMLVAASQKETRDKIIALFEDEYDYIEADTAQAVFDTLRQCTPEVILIHDDIASREFYQIIEQIRAIPGIGSTPIAYVSSDDAVLQRKALAAGADAYVTFTYDPAVVRLHIRNIVEKYLIQVLLPQRQLDYERMINVCLKLIYSQALSQDTLDEMLRISAEYMHAERAYFYEREGNCVVFRSEHLASGILPQRNDLRNVDMSVMHFWEALTGDDCYVCIDSAEDIKEVNPVIYERLKDQGIERMALMLVRVDGMLKGVIGYDNPTLAIESLRAYSENVFLFLNISMEKAEREKQLLFATYHDALTGVFNRGCFRRDLEIWKGTSVDRAGILYMDLNGLKEINDHQSHSAGDRLLQRCAKRLQSLCKSDMIYRMGGDEFVAVLPDMEEADFEGLLLRVKKEFDEESSCKAAVGSAYWRLGEDFEGKMICADRAMYEDKAAYYSSNGNNRRKRDEAARPCASHRR